jgi:hypothetical protein
VVLRGVLIETYPKTRDCADSDGNGIRGQMVFFLPEMGAHFTF